MGRVIIGMDPHKRSATIEAIDQNQRVLAAGRYATGQRRVRGHAQGMPRVRRPDLGGQGLQRRRQARRAPPGP